jgi:hypothetical protein
MKLQHYALILSVAVLAFISVALGARSASAEEPEITFQFPIEGQLIAEPPRVLQMCFKEPVNVKDLPPLDVGDFKFSLVRPDNVNLLMRIVFQPDGYGVAIYPDTAGADPPEGEWTWTYRVVDAASGDPLDGEVKLTTSAAEGEEILQPTPLACLAEGATNQPTAPPAGTEETSTATPNESTTSGDDDLSVLELALITVGIAAAAAVVGVLGFFFRKRVGYEPHAPSDDAGDSGDDHH